MDNASNAVAKVSNPTHRVANKRSAGRSIAEGQPTKLRTEVPTIRQTPNKSAHATR